MWTRLVHLHETSCKCTRRVRFARECTPNPGPGDRARGSDAGRAAYRRPRCAYRRPRCAYRRRQRSQWRPKGHHQQSRTDQAWPGRGESGTSRSRGVEPRPRGRAAAERRRAGAQEVKLAPEGVEPAPGAAKWGALKPNEPSWNPAEAGFGQGRRPTITTPPAPAKSRPVSDPMRRAPPRDRRPTRGCTAAWTAPGPSRRCW